MALKITIDIDFEDHVKASDAEAARVHLSNIVHQAVGLLGITGTRCSVTNRFEGKSEPLTRSHWCEGCG